MTLWPAVLAGALGIGLFARWVVGAPIESLAGGGTDGQRLRPLADPPVVGAAARLFRSRGASVVAVDERGERRILLPRRGES